MKLLTCIGLGLVYLILLVGVVRLFAVLDSDMEEESMSQLSFGWDRISEHETFRDVVPHIREAFWKFHQANPRIWELFYRFAHEAKAAGRAHYGVAAIFERIRWHLNVETTGEEFKLNNNYRSCYARMLMIHEPQLGRFFNTRRAPIRLMGGP